MMGNRESGQWAEIYSNIKQTHDAAYTAIDEAIKFEEQEKPSEAIEQYKTGIALIDEALNIQIECPENPDLTWEKARVMIQKMKKTRAEVLSRINSIQSQDGFVAPAPPPSYDEAMSMSSNSSGDQPRTYQELARALENMRIDEQNKQAEIIFSCDNVKLYFISPDGSVTLSNELQTLRIGTVEDFTDGQHSITILQIGEWVYPLVPGVSPCFRTDYGAFILPDLHSEVPGASVGLILPSDVDAQVYELLEDILFGIVCKHVPAKSIGGRSGRPVGISDVFSGIVSGLRVGGSSIFSQGLVPREPSGASDTISQGIAAGANYIHQGLVRGAEIASDFINYGTHKMINSIRPAQQERPVPREVQKGIKIAEGVSSTAVNATGFMANKVGTATMALGKYLAPHIEKQGTRLLATGFNMNEHEASEKMNGVLTVAAGAVEGFATVYEGLETSAGILGSSIKNNTVKIVEHKYGRPSGELVDAALSTVGNLCQVSQNIKYMAPKGIAKHTLTDTGEAMVEDKQ